MKKHDHMDNIQTASTPEQEKVETGAAEEPTTPEGRIKQLEELLTAREKEARENWDRFLRERADLENYRKRANREKEELLNYGTKSLIEEILPVMDNMERALAHTSEGDLSPVVEGIRMTHSMLMTALKKYGVTPVEALGAPFDPAFHEAMTRIPTDQYPPNTVVNEFQKGYMLRDRLLRPSMVSVAAAMSEE